MINAYNTQYFKYYALDKNLQNPYDISFCVEQGGNIEYNSLTSLKASCSINISLSALQTLKLDAIRIYEVLNGQERPLGTFYIATPSSNYEGNMQNIECIGYSTLWKISANTPSGKYFIGKGVNAVAEVKRILNSLNCTYIIPDSEKCTSNAKEWDYGTTYLDIINELLDTVNYTSIYVDTMGDYVAKPYILPQDKPVDLTLTKCDLEPVQQNEFDKFNIPNKFIRYCTSDPEKPIYAEYEYEGEVGGELGTLNTWTVVSCEEVSDVSDYATLYEKCKRACSDANSIYNKIIVNTDIQDIPTYLPIINLNHYKANGLFTCTSYNIDLSTGARMEMNLRQAITII